MVSHPLSRRFLRVSIGSWIFHTGDNTWASFDNVFWIQNNFHLYITRYNQKAKITLSKKHYQTSSLSCNFIAFHTYNLGLVGTQLIDFFFLISKAFVPFNCEMDFLLIISHYFPKLLPVPG